MKIGSSKNWSHNLGFSCCFRQPFADSHCKWLHGYALRFKADFVAINNELDKRNWVVDFGSLKSFKGMLEQNFDHTTIIAENDPEIETFKMLHEKGIIDLRIFPKVGCEAFAEFAFGALETWLESNGYSPRVAVQKVEVWEHEGNSAWVERS